MIGRALGMIREGTWNDEEGTGNEEEGTTLVNSRQENNAH